MAWPDAPMNLAGVGSHPVTRIVWGPNASLNAQGNYEEGYADGYQEGYAQGYVDGSAVPTEGQLWPRGNVRVGVD